MKPTLCAVLFVIMTNIVSAETPPTPASFDIKAAERFANLALACVHKEYPNKISHTLNSDADVAAPRKLTPAFYGCYDWHSSVHGHWLLVRLVRTFPNANFVQPAREALRQSLSPENAGAPDEMLATCSNRVSQLRTWRMCCLLGLQPTTSIWKGVLVHKNLSTQHLNAAQNLLHSRNFHSDSDWLARVLSAS